MKSTDTMTGLAIDGVVDGPTAVVRVAGSADRETCGHLRDHLSTVVDDAIVDVQIDVEALAFADSSCLHVLVHLAQVLDERGGKVTLVGTPPMLWRLLQVTGIDRLLDVRPQRT